MRAFGLPTIAALLCLAAGAGASADDAPRDEGFRAVDDFLNTVVTMAGSFKQQLVDPDGEVVDSSSGTLFVKRPGRFRWTYFEPYHQVLVADGTNVWSYDVDLEQVTVKPQAETLGNTPALLLGGSAAVLDDFDFEESFVDNGTLWVRLRPKDSENGFTRVELGFNDGRLTRMLFADNLDQTTLIALTDVTFNEPIADEEFRFEVPDGVDVVGQPLAPAPAAL